MFHVPFLLEASADGFSLLFAVFVIGIMLAFVVFCFYMVKKTSKKNIIKEQQKDELRRQQETYQTGIYARSPLVHISGLPIAENSWCNLTLYANALQFSTEKGVNINLACEKIIDVAKKTDVDIQKQYVSNAGKAIAGGMVFGAAGALVGGKPKEITQDNSKYYLVIAYRENNETKNIILDSTYVSKFQYGKFKDFQKLNADYEYLYKKLTEVCRSKNININL